MMFWVISVALALVVALLLVQALRHGAQAAPEAAPDVQVYRDQLAGVEQEVARGVLEASEAERLRVEISRRLLAADAAQGGVTRSGSVLGLSAVVAAALMAGSFGLYWVLGAPGYGDLGLQARIAMAEDRRLSRPSQADAEASLPPGALPQAEGVTEEYRALVAQLRKAVAEHSNDAQGLQLLASSERNLGNFAASHAAFAHYLDAIGDQAGASDFADHAELLVLAAGGYVSPEAEDALRAALQRDPGDGRALYFQGLMLRQTGRPDQALRIWDALLRRGPRDAPWIPPIMAQIREVADLAGNVRYEPPAPTGPDAAQVAAAADMDPEARMQMIEGMVGGLAARLAEEGGPPEDWARLITALGVLERRADAAQVYANAEAVFADNPGAMDLIRRAGQKAGVAE